MVVDIGSIRAHTINIAPTSENCAWTSTQIEAQIAAKFLIHMRRYGEDSLNADQL